MKDDTLITHAGLHPFDHHGVVNPPVYHASTVLYPDLDTLEGKKPVRYHYGRSGTPTTAALEEAATALEGGAGAVLAPSGLTAITIALQALTSTGDHILISDSVYAPTRNFCNQVLARYGVEVEYYDPRIGAEIEALFRPETRLVFTEAPGSQTFEMQDIPAISAAAHKQGLQVLMDNTWGAGWFCKGLALGADAVIHAGTKYWVGHADANLGAVVCNEETLKPIRHYASLAGIAAGPDDVYLALRGLKTLGVRLRHHQQAALQVARWLEQRPEVARVLHPALESDPGHELWQRDFTGSCGLFGFILHSHERDDLKALVEGRRYFGMGYSWGGFESLLIPTWPQRIRTATRWQVPGHTLRIHVGLEDPDDLIADLEEGFRGIAGGG